MSMKKTQKDSHPRPLHFAQVFDGDTECGRTGRRVRFVTTLQGWASASMREDRQCRECVKVVAERTGAMKVTP